MRSTWKQTTIGGHAADVFDPPNALPFIVLYLHAESGETPTGDAALTAELQARRLRCVAPHAGRSWWVDRRCPEFDSTISAERHLLDHVLPWIESTWNVGPRTLGVAGREMGGQGAVRLALRHPDRFPVAASLGGAFDFHEHYGRGTPLDEMYPSREHARQDTAVLHVPARDWPKLWFACSPRDPWYRGNDRLHEKLAALGAEHTARLDVDVDYDRLVPELLTFVLATLECESRRLM